ncbi:MAG TPA: transcription antitermination factor NusB [Gemmatimonadaceae bacterium]|jgi:N utilization substance protein B|nr:transcription antitermination factor NusB [Gemmatimonadaceae bacterium]
MPRLRAETRARARALQALYAWDLRDGEPLDRIANQVWDDLAIAPDERAFAGRIVRTIIAEGKAIDDALRDVTTNWRLERLGAVERAVLRIAAAELLRGDPPPRVTIQEAVRLAERYGSEQSARFVNGVLDALARKMGRL